MATRSRTYQTSDWQVWTYQPTPGVLRLDFSKWDDGSDWGSTGGSIGLVDLPIASITIDETAQPISGISQFQAGTASISFQTTDLDKTVLNEFYTGKPIWITLKNEETAKTHADFGQATPIFSGYISSATMSFNKFNHEQTINITVTDSMQYAFNTPISIAKNASGASYYKYDDIALAITNSFYLFQNDERSKTKPIDCFYWNSGHIEFSGSDPSMVSMIYETTETSVKSLGEWIQDLGNTLASKWIGAFRYRYTTPIDDTSHFIGFKRFVFYKDTIVNSFSSYPVIEYDKIYSLEVGNSIPDKPSVFSLSTVSGLQYDFGLSAANSSNQVISYSQTIDSPLSDLDGIVQNMLDTKSFMSVTALDLEMIREGQTITFDDRTDSKYLLPYNYVDVGSAMFVDLTADGFESGDCYTFVTARTINVTPDNVTINYKLRRTE